MNERIKTPAAAVYVGLSTSTLEKLRLTGDGPLYLKLNRAVVYDTSDLDDWLQSRRKRSTSESDPSGMVG